MAGFDERLIINIALLIVGGSITFILTKLLSKQASFIHKIVTERVALSNQDPIFGSIQVTWQNKPVKNLFFSTIEIENASTKDFKYIKFKIFTPNDVFILSANSILVNTTYSPLLTDEYLERTKVREDEKPNQAQMDTYFHEKEYICEVFNRGQKIQVQVLTNCITNNMIPDVFLDIQHEGVKLKWQKNQVVIHGVPIYTALPWSLFASAVILIIIVYLIDSVLLASLITFLIGLFAQSIGAIIYKTYRILRDLISN